MISDKSKEQIKIAIQLIRRDGDKEEYANALYEYGRYVAWTEGDVPRGMKAVQLAKQSCMRMIHNGTGASWVELDKYCQKKKQSYSVLDLFYKCLLAEAQYGNFDSYMLYIEKDRPYKDRFYLPRRKCFRKIGVVQALQDMIDDKLDILSISMPPGSGKTTLEKFFHSYICGLYPKDFNLFFSHSAEICKMYYEGVLAIVDGKDYLWSDVFPGLRVSQKNAKAMSFNVGNYKPFQNLMTGSVGSELSGRVRCSKFLLVDDMIGKIEEALNINTLDKLWDVYRTDARQRKIDGCKEIHIATRWSVHDVIGRLQQAYSDNPRARFIAVPDIDPDTGESNFAFDFNGFSVEFFHEQEAIMDEISYKCLYKNEPIEREGLLYHEDELRRYLDLPGREPDAILSVCDTKSKGIDFMVLPVIFQYDYDFYLVDCICDDSSDFDNQYARLTDILEKYNVQQCEFESNAGGDRIAHEVSDRLKERKCRCNVTTKPTETNKETRILANSDWIKKNVLFKDKSEFDNKSDYGKFMSQLMTYSVTGKNAHDDVPDCMANFCLFITNKERIRPSVITRGIL